MYSDYNDTYLDFCRTPKNNVKTFIKEENSDLIPVCNITPDAKYDKILE